MQYRISDNAVDGYNVELIEPFICDDLDEVKELLEKIEALEHERREKCRKVLFGNAEKIQVKP